MAERTCIAIDLKSFYASVECAERGLDPLTTNLVVADLSRTEKTICLAVTPSLKAWGISGRARLFEVVEKVKEVNAQRLRSAPGGQFSGSSSDDTVLKADPSLALDYIIAPPRMAHYMKWSTEIYNIYLKYIAPEDIHVYSIDEVLMDVTNYLETYKLSARELAMKMILDVLHTTGITATAGIGTNLYLCKIAMDIVAKHIHPDMNGVRIASLNERTYRRLLWSHRPLTDFWRVGRGYTKKLEANGLYTMGDVARCSLGGPGDFYNEDLLYKLFGINAELLIDHAWGWEPCTIADIKAYKPETKSVGGGQVLQCPYDYEKARLVLREMADQLSLDLVEKKLAAKQLVLTVGYDIENLKGRDYKGEVTTDRYGRAIPKHAQGTENLEDYTASTKRIVSAALALFDRIIDKKLLVRRLYLTAAHVLEEGEIPMKEAEQLDLFTDYAAQEARQDREEAALAKERKMQETLLAIKKKYGKNAILKGMNLEEGATAKSRNTQIGGHKA
jgi:DNA polymerase V